MAAHTQRSTAYRLTSYARAHDYFRPGTEHAKYLDVWQNQNLRIMLDEITGASPEAPVSFRLRVVSVQPDAYQASQTSQGETYEDIDLTLYQNLLKQSPPLPEHYGPPIRAVYRGTQVVFYYKSPASTTAPGARRFRLYFADKSDVPKVIDAIKAHCHCTESKANDAAKLKNQTKTQRQQTTLLSNPYYIPSSQLPIPLQYSQSTQLFDDHAAPVVSALALNRGVPSAPTGTHQQISSRIVTPNNNIAPPPLASSDTAFRPRSALAMDPPLSRSSSVWPDSLYPPPPPRPASTSAETNTGVQCATSSTSMSQRRHDDSRDQLLTQTAPLPLPRSHFSMTGTPRAAMEARNGSGSSGSLSQSQNQLPSSGPLLQLAPTPTVAEEISRIHPHHGVDVSSDRTNTNTSAAEALITSLRTKEGCVGSMLSLNQSELRNVVLELLSEPGFGDLVDKIAAVLPGIP